MTRDEMLNSVLDYVFDSEVNHFSEYMSEKLGDDTAEKILEGDWQRTIVNNPSVREIAEGHVCFQTWYLKTYKA